MEIIVVGAGLSGLKTAEELTIAGYNVLILQANNYPGGRTHTSQILLNDGSKFMFDQGATEIHKSCNDHPITILGKQAQTKVVPGKFQEAIFFNQKGQQLNQIMVENVRLQYKKVLKELQKFEIDGSVYDGIKKICPQKLQDPIFMYHASFDMEFETSAKLQDVSGKQAFNDDEFDGQHMIVYSGYQKISEHIIKKNKLKILYEHVVQKITSKQGFHEILCKNGKKFQCQKVVISVPLGVLKNNKITFDPVLPIWKQDAINKMAIGNVCKIIVVFEKQILDIKQSFIGLINENIKDRGFLSFWMNFAELTNQPVLMTFGFGENADILQNMTEQHLKIEIYKKLKILSKNQFSISDYRVYKTTWKNRQTSCGAYSYSPVNCGFKEFKALAKPIFQLGLYFCGQHTTQRFRSSAHGAYLSGLYTSKTIINKVNEQNWIYFDENWDRRIY